MLKQKVKNFLGLTPDKDSDTKFVGVSESKRSESGKTKLSKSNKSWSFRRTSSSRKDTESKRERSKLENVTGDPTTTTKQPSYFSRGGSRSSGDSAFGSLRRKFRRQKPIKDQSNPEEEIKEVGQLETPESPRVESDRENTEVLNQELTDDDDCEANFEDRIEDDIDETEDHEEKSRFKRFFSKVRNSLRLSKRSKDSGYYGSVRYYPRNSKHLEDLVSVDTPESLETIVNGSDAEYDFDSLTEEKFHTLEFQPVQPEDDWSTSDHQPVYGATGGEDVESVISKMETDYCDSNGPVVLQLETVPVTRPSIRALYNDPEKVYPMSSVTRGRVLIFNNFHFYKNGIQNEDLTRYGTGADYDNFVRMFKSLHFDIAKPQKELSNLTKTEMLNTIKEETQRPEHSHYGMFVLVVMSHGKEENKLYDRNCKLVSLVEMEKLLSASEFPAMSGKPKLIIAVACSGDKPDIGYSHQTSISPSSPVPCSETPMTSEPKMSVDGGADGTAQNSTPSSQTKIKTFNAEDFCRMKSSSEPYTSLRDNTNGSWYVRILVATFYKHACHRDIESLCKIIQKRVTDVCRRSSMALEHGGCVPMSHNTFTDYRKLYLFPGVHADQKDKVCTRWSNEFLEGPATSL